MELHVAAHHLPVAAFRAVLEGLAVGRAVGAAAQQHDHRPPQDERPHSRSPAAHNVWVPNRSWYRAARLQGTGLNSIPGYRQNLRRDLVGLSRSFFLHFSKASPGSFFVRRCSHLESARRGGHFLPDPCAPPARSITSGPSPLLAPVSLGSVRRVRLFQANFRSVGSNFSRRRRNESFQETRARERGPKRAPRRHLPRDGRVYEPTKDPARVRVLSPPHGPSEKFSSPAEESLLSRSCPGIRRRQAGRYLHRIRSAFQNKITNWRLDVTVVL